MIREWKLRKLHRRNHRLERAYARMTRANEQLLSELEQLQRRRATNETRQRLGLPPMSKYDHTAGLCWCGGNHEPTDPGVRASL